MDGVAYSLCKEANEVGGGEAFRQRQESMVALLEVRSGSRIPMDVSEQCQRSSLPASISILAFSSDGLGEPFIVSNP